MRLIVPSALALALAASLSLPGGQTQQPPPAPPADLGRQVLAILEQNCYKCHGQNGANEGGVNYVLDLSKLVEKGKFVPGDEKKSRLLRRIADGGMPPEDEKQRPTEEQVALIRAWVKAGAPAPAPLPAAAVAQTRPFKTQKDVLKAVHAHLTGLNAQDRSFQRYFTLTHLHNMPKVKAQDMRLYRAALSKLVNSLSWKPRIVVPQPVDLDQTVFAVDLRDLDWDRHNLWRAVLAQYPYGLKHDQYPRDQEVQTLYAQVCQMCGTDLPAVRADWFIATASRPPLYHTLVRIPQHAGELETMLQVNVAENFRRGRAARGGFAGSGISGQNRMVERHDALYGAYWKSYDFKPNKDRSNLFKFPLGPAFDDHPFPNMSFEHDGGEIIFHLPNGMQAYMLVDGKDNRIDEGPTDVVGDRTKTSGSTIIVNGLSCMSCHAQGMIPDFKDSIRTGSSARGRALDHVEMLYPPADKMQKLMEDDSERFLRAVDAACGEFLRQGPGDKTDARSFPETIGPIARWYRSQDLGPEEVAVELGLQNPVQVQAAVQISGDLQKMGLGPLANGDPIKREAWESREFFNSPYQETARVLRLGTPFRMD